MINGLNNLGEFWTKVDRDAVKGESWTPGAPGTLTSQVQVQVQAQVHYSGRE